MRPRDLPFHASNRLTTLDEAGEVFACDPHTVGRRLADIGIAPTDSVMDRSGRVIHRWPMDAIVTAIYYP